MGIRGAGSAYCLGRRATERRPHGVRRAAARLALFQGRSSRARSRATSSDGPGSCACRPGPGSASGARGCAAEQQQLPGRQPGGRPVEGFDRFMSLPMLERAARELEPFLDEVAFVGGATIALWITDPGAPAPRATKDVDVVVEVASRLAWHNFEERIRAHGLRHDTSSTVICRWKVGGPDDELLIDLMPSEPAILEAEDRRLAGHQVDEEFVVGATHFPSANDRARRIVPQTVRPDPLLEVVPGQSGGNLHDHIHVLGRTRCRCTRIRNPKGYRRSADEGDFVEKWLQLPRGPLEHREAHEPIESFNRPSARLTSRELLLLRSASTSARR